MKSPRKKTKPRNLREECLGEALAVIEESGVESLSMREVARRLSVSHQAPYKHFRSREHILAELIARAFATFAAFLDARPQAGKPAHDLAAMGKAYLSYATEHPLQYRLMFATKLPKPSEHPQMMEQARHAFALLQNDIARVHAAQGRRVSREAVDHDAFFVWSTLHGLASILEGETVTTLEVSSRFLAAAPGETLKRIGLALFREV